MTHAEVSQLLIKWFTENPDYKGWFLLQNATGYGHDEHTHYGCPPCGGGFDYFAFGQGKAEFFEVKTENCPTLRKSQKIFRDNMIKAGCKTWVFREWKDSFYIVPAEKYRPKAKWPY